MNGRSFAALCVLKAHLDSLVKVQPGEVPRHPCSSPPAFGETRATKRGVKPSPGGCKPPVRSMKRSLPRRKKDPSRGGTTGSRAWSAEVKAREGVKRLGVQPRRTLRRRGPGTVGQPRWEQERPVSAPAVRPQGCHLRGGLGATNPISVRSAKWGRAERESEEVIVPSKPRTTEPWQREGPLAERAAQRRGNGIAARLLTRGTTFRREGCWGTRPTPVAGRNAECRLLGGEPCAGEAHARF
jgi:hypothetical protein